MKKYEETIIEETPTKVLKKEKLNDNNIMKQEVKNEEEKK